jgi:hypothetical protein
MHTFPEVVVIVSGVDTVTAAADAVGLIRSVHGGQDERRHDDWFRDDCCGAHGRAERHALGERRD